MSEKLLALGRSAEELKERLEWLTRRIQVHGVARAKARILQFMAVCDDMQETSAAWKTLVQDGTALADERVELSRAKVVFYSEQAKFKEEQAAFFKQQADAEAARARAEQTLSESNIVAERHAFELQQLRDKLKLVEETQEATKNTLSESQRLACCRASDLERVQQKLEAAEQRERQAKEECMVLHRDKESSQACAREAPEMLEQEVARQYGLMINLEQTNIGLVAEKTRLSDRVAELETLLKSKNERNAELEQVGVPRSQDASLLSPPQTAVRKRAFEPHTPLQQASKRSRVRAPDMRPPDQVRWGTEVNKLVAFLSCYTPLCPDSSGLTLREALLEFVAVPPDSASDLLADFLTEGPREHWFCFRQLAEDGYDGEALIQGEDCYLHKDKCFQIQRAGPDRIEVGAICCRLIKY
ncbi:hypothetical protein GGR56DRAFT_248538 [Xylariaceae sp. FL0804]|nr:hypothetical protein GGR56DRAFT_248538 [Xylariaceae sp. FL0804]